MKKLVLIVIVVLIVLAVFVLVNRKAEAPVSTVDYRCGDGSEFTLDYSADKGSIHIIPASNIERVPDTTVTSLPAGSRERYEGGGVSLFFVGKELRVTVGESPEVIICNQISS